MMDMIPSLDSWEQWALRSFTQLFFSFNTQLADSNLPLRVELWNGRRVDLGDFAAPKITVKVNTWRGLWLLLRPNLNSIGEAYMNEEIDIVGDLEDIVDVGFKLVARVNPSESAFERFTRLIPHSRLFDRESIQHHYDVSNDFYRLWLDEHMVYSCAYFESGDETLAEAQIAKVDHILRKVQLRPGQRLLDLGCGWGTAVIRAAERFGAKCVGVTISERQFELARERVAKAGLEDRVEIRLCDYRDIEGQFDRVISIGMYEHVGESHLKEYFEKVHSLLTDDGFFLNHGLNACPGSGFAGGTEFVQRYIFPGSHMPELGAAVGFAEAAGWEPLDIENLRKHYAETMRHWARNYERQSAEIRQMIGEAKYRAWRMYLGGSVQSFVNCNVTVNQMLLHKAGRHPDVVPRNRRFIYEQRVDPESAVQGA